MTDDGDWFGWAEDAEPDETPPPKRHSFLQEEARFLAPLLRASTEVGNEWRQSAVCGEVCREQPGKMDDWFAPDATAEARNAADLCFQCPVRQKCLEWACTSKAKLGIWGGLPESVRISTTFNPERIRPHDYEELVKLSNPYDTTARNRFHWTTLRVWERDEDE